MTKIHFNNKTKLILSDVDETIADVYCPATPEMIHELNLLLETGRVLFLLSGGGLESIRSRIVDKITSKSRHRILVAHCMGAEIWGFDSSGNINQMPFYSVYNSTLSEAQKNTWRVIINETISAFNLNTFPTQPREDFIKNSKQHPLSVMLADRGPQITFECVNSINLTHDQVHEIQKKLSINIPQTHGKFDLRIPIMEKLNRLYMQYNLPIEPRLGGIFALDSILKKVNKTKAIQYIIGNKNILTELGVKYSDIDEAEEIEIWGDKFSQKTGGPDFDMCKAVSPSVRAIDFRNEDVNDLPKGYNIQIWDGKRHLHDGLLEYLNS